MGDALAIALLEARGFSAHDFARVHPKGALGRRLLLKVGDLMHTGAELPILPSSARLDDALLEITQKSLGMTLVADDHITVIGIFTDGDLRRALANDINIHQSTLGDVMTTQFSSMKPGSLATEALSLMRARKITALPVLDESHQALGVIHLHDLLRAGIHE
jgi:arabinose-5-phosphate isomerase